MRWAIIISMLILIVSSGSWAAIVDENAKPADSGVTTTEEDATVDGDPTDGKAEDNTPKPLDMDQLKAMLKTRDATLYRTEQEKIEDMIAELVKPHVPELIRRLKTEKSADLIRLLGYSKTPTAGKAVAEFLDSKDTKLRSAAIYSVGVCEYRDAEEKLIKMLESDDVITVSQAAISLGRMKSDKCYDALVKLLDSDKLAKRLSAIRALGLLGDQRGATVLEARIYKVKDPLETTAILDALNLIAGDNIMRIIDQLQRIGGVLETHGTGLQTQVAQAAVTDALSRFIKEQEEKSQQSSSSSSSSKRQTSQGQAPQQQQAMSSGKSQGGTQAPDDKQGQDVAAAASKLNEIMRSHGSSWGSLPPAVQEEITAALKQDLPERYRRLLELYLKILAEGN